MLSVRRALLAERPVVSSIRYGRHGRGAVSKLSLHEEFPDAVADAIAPFLAETDHVG
jgi:hypothetical protein